jgi:CHAT domain-containing protein
MDVDCLPTAPRDPLLLSGVVLAGAFRLVPEGSRGAEEGLLASAEVAQLDLSATRLLVWSGCATATGSVLPGEPMCGLAAAGWLAGADCSVATLWEISDEKMPRQMEALYRWWFQGASPARALQQALLEGIAATQSAHGHTHPGRWAALVVEGQ